MTEQPEFSRPVAVDRIVSSPSAHPVAAEPDEREALAERFGLLGIALLRADIDLHRDGDRIVAHGTVFAELEQQCAATGDAVPATIEEPFELHFLPEGEVPSDEEIELSESECETVFHDGSGIDLGEAVAQTMGLALDPFPRSPRAETVLKEAGVKQEGEIQTRALSGLKDLMEKGGKN